MASFFDLINVPSATDFVNKFAELLRLAGFPIASWHSGSFQKHTVETESSLLSDLSGGVRSLALSWSPRLAKLLGPDWVELSAYEARDVDPKPALATQGILHISDTGGIGPLVKQAGSYWAANPDHTLRYVNVNAFTIPLNGSVDTLFQAESPGTGWNIGAGGITDLLTPEPGVTVSNPAGTAGTWITRQGVDRESSDALIQRCADKWSTLGSGSNDAAYRWWATTPPVDATDAQRALWSESSRPRVYSPAPGSVRIVLAGPSGPVSTPALTAIAAYIESKRPSGVWDVVTSNATVNAQIIGGAIRVTGVDPATALAKAQAAVSAFAALIPIGGNHGKVSREAIIKALMVDGVEDLDNVTPAADFTLAANEVFVPTFALTASYAT